MFLGSFINGEELPERPLCDDAARIIDVEYTYRKEFIGGRFQKILDEVHYTMECPKCGKWKRVETVHMDLSAAHALTQ
jgi:hypothetical protein